MPLVEGRATVLAEEWLFSIRVELNRLQQEAQIHIPGMMEMFPQEHSLQGCKSHGNAPTGATHCSLPGMLKPSGHRMSEPSPIPAAPPQLSSLGPGLCTPSMGLCQIPPQTPVTERAAQESIVLWQCTAQEAPLGTYNPFMFLWEYK